MEEIKRQVARARRRMNLAQFLRLVSWSLTAALAVALIGVAIPRLWVISVAPDVWNWSWIGGAAGAGLIVGWIIAFVRRRGDLEAAIELDRRYGLKERVSSSLSLTAEERQSDFGQALLNDAARRVERIDVREQFAVPMTWRSLLPLVPALGMFLVMFFVPLAESNVTASPDSPQAHKERAKKAVTELEKKIEMQKKEAAEKGLKDAEAMLDELAKRAQELKSDNPADRKEAMVKLNDMAKELQKRKNELASNEQFKKQLEELKDLEKGPGDKLGEALKEGDMNEAAKEMKNLIDKLKNGELDKEDAKKLGDKLEQVQKKIEELQAKHEQKKQELQDQIDEAKKNGNQEDAAKLQEQLDKMKAQDKQMNGMMKKMADKLGKAAQQLKEGKPGDQQAAAQEMQELAEELEEMQDQLAEMDALDEAMEQLEDAKNAMNCKKCNGQGCKACQGKGQGDGENDGPPGEGLGKGIGKGARPEEANDTKSYLAKERGKVGKGKSERTGDAAGPNIPGRAKQVTSEEVSASLAKDADPINEEGLPRDQRNHSKEYFEKLLEGK
jgi:hypothetical protein